MVYFLVMPLSGLGIWKMLASEVRKYFICFYLLVEIVDNQYNSFRMCLVDFTSEPILDELDYTKIKSSCAANNSHQENEDNL